MPSAQRWRMEAGDPMELASLEGRTARTGRRLCCHNIGERKIAMILADDKGGEQMLKATQLTKRFDGVTALNGLNLFVGAGQILCLVGPNGAGKTTTINLFLGFLKPDSGATCINGIDVMTHPVETKRHLAYIPRAG